MSAFAVITIGALGMAYSYFLYPLLLLLLPGARKGASGTPDESLRMSLIIAAHNEKRRIRDKILESVRLRERCPSLEILVASDASTDGTDEIVAEFGAEGVRLVRTAERRGKENAQREAIQAATGNVIVFTDTGTTIVPSSVDRIMELFSDPSIGAISSTDRVLNQDGQVSGEGLYIRYEMWLRELESRKGGLIGLSGSFFAARRRVCEGWDTEIPSDFAVAMTAGQLGLRAISDPDVIGEYRDTRNPEHEFARKVRTVIRGMAAVARKRAMLNPFRYGRLAFQLWSHKILRWGVPWFGIVYVAGCAALPDRTVGLILIAPAIALFVAAALAAAAPSLRRGSLLGASYFFIQVNCAALIAALQFLAGRRVTMWAPTTR